MRRKTGTIVGAAVLLAAALFATVGHAAGLSTAANSLGGGNSPIAKCDADGVTTLQVLNAGANVTSVTIAGIAAACGTATLSVTVNNNAGSNSPGSAAGPGGGGSMTVALAAGVTMKDSDQVDVTITGP